ncbi:Na/Pi cotransporter family protein [Sulfurovum sp. ST-21]|uniref:Na/Pi cotransporter family protein n=1 Tax=Sulfurovum indicum TaxID=2779528 RepID=A0A7M1S677_9BACT|nr:Na/Pi symporter [Sulfurovum indicum]QOR62846.1 Na/Pi cotransporter family protein [Sulfurovum indicum]
MDGLSLVIILKVTGGLGIFLLGMIIMTDGLRSLAGDRMRNLLMHFTRSPISGAATGAAVTAILQSSSATTVAAVGFVSAGLLAFPEALGIIFGANIGTTITGWMVVLFGFKLNLGTAVLPVIFIGAVLKLFFKKKLAATGYALAGFGLIFIGITFLQEGMSGFEGIITPENLPSHSFTGILKLVALGVITTVITQSSSAGVAATLTALFANTINFEQAAALIIGMDMGTTVTALLASIGGSANAKRTSLSHVIYNIFTAVMAVFLITPFVHLWEYIAPVPIVADAQIALVAFHTLFNTIGVLVILPFTHRFAMMMEKIIPPEKPKYTMKLDTKILEEANLALEAVRISIQNEFTALLEHINFILGDSKNGAKADLRMLQAALNETREYLDAIDLKQQDDAKWKELISLIHILDHLFRLYERCEEDAYRARVVQKSAELQEEHDLLIANNTEVIRALNSRNFSKAENVAKKSEEQIGRIVEPYRKEIARNMAEDKISMHMGTSKLEAVRWLVRVSHHISRIASHMKEAVFLTAK